MLAGWMKNAERQHRDSAYLAVPGDELQPCIVLEKSM